MPRTRQKARADNKADEFFKESRLAFGEQYRAINRPYVLIAQNGLEALVEQGTVTAQEALLILHTPSTFAEFLLKAEQSYQDHKDQKIHDRMAGLERNTHWKSAATISIGAGMVTGLVFAVGAPFFSAWLQPTVDELMKRQPAAQAPAAVQPQIVENITNQYVYGSNALDAKPTSPRPPSTARTDAHSLRTTLTCRNVTAGVYRASLPGLLQHGNIVTLDMNGKKVFMCYRPNARPTTQQVLANK